MKPLTFITTTQGESGQFIRSEGETRSVVLLSGGFQKTLPNDQIAVNAKMMLVSTALDALRSCIAEYGGSLTDQELHAALTFATKESIATRRG